MSIVSRRTLLKYGSFTAASIALSPILSGRADARSIARDPGLQLISVGGDLATDMPGTLAKVAAMGYRWVESAGIPGNDPKAFRKALDAAGLKCPSSHLFLMPGQTYAEYFDNVKTAGSDHVVSSYLIKPEVQVRSGADFVRYSATLTEDDFKAMADGLNKLALQAKAAGLKLAYHNHNVEFRQWADGSNSFDTLLAGTDPALVKVELDCGMAEIAGRSPLSILEANPGRIWMLHAKNCAPVAKPIVAMGDSGSVQWTSMGKGHIDYPALLAAAPKAGVEGIIVEQGAMDGKTALQVVGESRKYLRSIG